jgi:hypothetical protein
MVRYLFVAILFSTLSCNKEEIYSKETLLKRAQTADSSVTVVLPRSMTDGVHCSDYPEGCLSAHIVRVKGLDMIAVEYPTNKEAVYAAKKVRGYYVRNWLLDDVKGEPVLEKFVSEKLEAKMP